MMMMMVVVKMMMIIEFVYVYVSVGSKVMDFACGLNFFIVLIMQVKTVIDNMIAI